MIEIPINQWERIDDLQCKGLKIIQNTKGFCFGIDAVLISDFAVVKKGERVFDLGTGTGIIPILLAGKTKAEEIYGIDIQKDIVEMANRSIELNKLYERVKILHGDLKDCWNKYGLHRWDIVISNPPYMVNNSGFKNTENTKAISRHEIMCSLEDVIKTASKLLKYGGKFYIIHRPERLADIICLLRAYKLEPKKLRFVYPYLGKPANLILIESISNSKPSLKMIEPLYVHNKDGSYTEEIDKIYGRSNQNGTR